MIAHVVLMRPKDGLSADDRLRFLEAFERAVQTIPDVRAVRVGRRLTHGAQYEGLMPDTGAYLAIIDFDDLAGLQSYLKHPAHEALGRLFDSSLASALVYDFEVRGSGLRWILDAE